MTRKNCFKTKRCWRRDLLLRQFASFAQLPSLAKELMQRRNCCNIIAQSGRNARKDIGRHWWNVLLIQSGGKFSRSNAKFCYFWVENLGSKNPACGKEMINMKYGFTQSKRWNGKDFSQTHSDPPFSLSGQCPFKKHQRIPTETDTQGRYLEKKAPWMKCRSNSWHLGGATIHSLIRRKRLKQQEVLWPEPAGLSRAPSPFFETTTTFIALISPPPSLPTHPNICPETQKLRPLLLQVKWSCKSGQVKGERWYSKCNGKLLFFLLVCLFRFQSFVIAFALYLHFYS